MQAQPTLTPERFNSIQKDVVKYIRKKLAAMEMDVTYIELHNSSFDKTLRVYATLARTTNLKALYLAERMVCKEVKDEFGLAPNAIYWRYFPAGDPAPTIAA
ncbi:MAG: hypothetical protein V4463_12705 [Pseudomonadota bacterium]